MTEEESKADRMRSRITFKFDNKVYHGIDNGWVDENGQHPYGASEYGAIDGIFTYIEMNEVDREQGRAVKSVEEIKEEEIKSLEESIEYISKQ